MRQRAAFRKVHGCEVGGTREPQLISKHNRWGDDHIRHSAVFNNFHWCTKCKHHLRESWAVRQNVTFPSFSHALPHECPPYRMSRCVRICPSLTKDFLMTLSLPDSLSRSFTPPLPPCLKFISCKTIIRLTRRKLPRKRWNKMQQELKSESCKRLFRDMWVYFHEAEN